jgi:hypothetical protein
MTHRLPGYVKKNYVFLFPLYPEFLINGFKGLLLHQPGKRRPVAA